MSEPMREEVAVYPLSEKQITVNILDSARKAVASHTVGMGRNLIDTAHLYAAYCIIRESQLRASILTCKKAEAANREKDYEIERLKGCVENLDRQLASLRASGGEKWIEIKEGCEMPAQSGRILVYCPDSSLFLEMHGSPIGRIFFRAERGARGFIFKKVTHWMPYKEPAPPTLTREKE